MNRSPSSGPYLILAEKSTLKKAAEKEKSLRNLFHCLHRVVPAVAPSHVPIPQALPAFLLQFPISGAVNIARRDGIIRDAAERLFLEQVI